MDSRRRVVALACALFPALLAVTASSFAASDSGTFSVSVEGPIVTKMTRSSVIQLMNRDRSRRGLPVLVENPKLDQAAADRVADMQRLNYFDHISPSGQEPFVWMDRNGYRYRSAGENLAEGYDSPLEQEQGWMDSPGHRRNILADDFEEVGVAIAPGSPDGQSEAGDLVVVMFGRM